MKRADKYRSQKCDCGGQQEVVDTSQDNKTWHCAKCHECFLVIQNDEVECTIKLNRFYDHRLASDSVRSVDDIGLGELFHHCLAHEIEPPKILRDAYGIRNEDHQKALGLAAREFGIGPYEFDRLIGDGVAISDLVAHLPIQEHLKQEFRSIHDVVWPSIKSGNELDRYFYLPGQTPVTSWRDEQKCDCSGELAVVDQHFASRTTHCKECNLCYLEIDSQSVSAHIRLNNFHFFRLSDGAQRPVDDIAMATDLRDKLLHREVPSGGEVADFGITSLRHLGSIQYGVKTGQLTAYDLDRVVGDGQAITDLMRSLRDNPYRQLEFKTDYDDMIQGRQMNQEKKNEQEPTNDQPERMNLDDEMEPGRPTNLEKNNLTEKSNNKPEVENKIDDRKQDRKTKLQNKNTPWHRVQTESSNPPPKPKPKQDLKR